MPEQITWYAPEFKYHHKELAWYWLSIIAAGILFLIALWQRNLLFGIFVIIAELLVIIWAKEYPKNISFKLDKRGLGIGKIKIYAYQNLEGFHIHESGNDEFVELIFKTNKRLHPHLTILTDKNDLEEVKEFLKQHLSEIEYEEPLSEAISRIIGF